MTRASRDIAGRSGGTNPDAERDLWLRRDVAAGGCRRGAWLATDPLRGLLLRLGVVWAAAVLAFLGGVRRGSSFYTVGGPTLAQMLTMLWLFAVAFVALLSGSNGAALALLTTGYASVAILDPIAARRGEVPAHFARLRPPQMMVAIMSLLLMATVVIRR